MVIDTSALIAHLLHEPPSARILAALEAEAEAALSAASYVECSIVLQGKRGDAGPPALDELLVRLGVEVVPVTLDQALVARGAFRRFGKGRHPAALNFGDCFSYALAVARGEPLLFVGDDFARTDMLVAGY